MWPLGILLACVLGAIAAPWQRSRATGLFALQVVLNLSLIALVSSSVLFAYAPDLVPAAFAAEMDACWKGMRDSNQFFVVACYVLGSPWLVTAIAGTIALSSLILQVRRQRRQVELLPAVPLKHSTSSRSRTVLLKHLDNFNKE